MTEVMSRDSVRVKPEPPAHLVKRGLDRCGHCKGGHCKSCKGAVRVPKSRVYPLGLLICYCRVCDKQIRCLDCGNQFAEDVNAEMWRCWDKNGCLGRIRLRQQSDRLWRMIQECKTVAANKRREDRERRQRILLSVGPEEPDRVARRAPRPTSGACRCCGTETKGGEFAPGHDAKYKSRLRRLSKLHDKAAYKELVERGWT